MKKYAVALYLELSDGNTLQQRLQCHFVDATSRDEAFGKVIHDPERPDAHFRIAYHLTQEVPV